MDSAFVDQAEADIRRGQRAAAFLEEDGVFRTAWAELEATILNAWRTSPARDTEARERLYTMLKVMGDLEGVILAYVNDGKMAAAQIERAKEFPA